MVQVWCESLHEIWAIAIFVCRTYIRKTYKTFHVMIHSYVVMDVMIHIVCVMDVANSHIMLPYK